MSAAPPGRPPEDPIAEATRIQREVADPRVSAAVRAGAGSGKTHVLVSRIVRLCLAGADPKSIVAVTFTKKAAVEIKARLLKELRVFAVMAEPARREALHALLAREPEPAELDRAATLYDRFLEDLPGLPIGTIHAWCQRLLGRFPADLGLDPSFEVSEKPEDLWEEALDRLEAQTVSDPVQRAELASLAVSPPGVRQTLTGFFTDRLALDRWLGRLADDRDVSALDVERLTFHAAMVEDLQRTLFRGTPLEGSADPHAADLAPTLIAAAERFAEMARGPLATLAPKAVTPSARTQLDGFANAPVHAHAFAAAADDDGARAAAAADLRRLLLTQGDKLRALKGGKAGKEERDAAYVSAARPLPRGTGPQRPARSLPAQRPVAPVRARRARHLRTTEAARPRHRLPRPRAARPPPRHAQRTEGVDPVPARRGDGAPAGGRIPGHEPQPVGRAAPHRGRVPRRRGGPRHAPHRVRGRRRETVDLPLPRRGAGPVRHGRGADESDRRGIRRADREPADQFPQRAGHRGLPWGASSPRRRSSTGSRTTRRRT